MPLLANLCQISLTVLPTTGEAERHWSEFGNIHTLQRNRLDLDRAEKLDALESLDAVRPTKQSRLEIEEDDGIKDRGAEEPEDTEYVPQDILNDDTESSQVEKWSIGGLLKEPEDALEDFE